MAVPQQLLALVPLLVEQQAVHAGQQGGLGQAQSRGVRAAALRFPEPLRKVLFFLLVCEAVEAHLAECHVNDSSS